jgi:hypothetical protein
MVMHPRAPGQKGGSKPIRARANLSLSKPTTKTKPKFPLWQKCVFQNLQAKVLIHASNFETDDPPRPQEMKSPAAQW